MEISGIQTKYWHASFDEVTEFVPRVPRHRLDGEDDTTPRICVTEVLAHSVSAIPGIMNIASGCAAIGYAPIIHAYEISIGQEAVITTRELKKMIPDAGWTGECWLTGKPVHVQRHDFRWHAPGAFVKRGRDGIALILATGTFEETALTDGVADFVNFTKAPQDRADDLYRLVRKTGMSAMLCSLTKPMSYAIMKNRERNKEGR